MSVINNVLKDLETRESCFSPIEIDSLAPPSAARRDVKKPALALFVIGLLTAAGWIYLQPQPVANLAAPATPKPADTATAISAEQAVAVNTAPVAAPATPKPADTATAISVEQAAAVNTAPVAAPVPTAEPANAATEQTTGNQIVGLQIRESEQGMRFEFVLRARAAAYLKQRSENSFAYHLGEIESQIVAPEISDNRWITELAITPAEQGVDIRFETAADVLVETRQSLIDGEPVWAINLRQAEPPPAIAVAAVAPTLQPGATTPAAIEPAAIEPAAIEPVATAPADIEPVVNETRPAPAAAESSAPLQSAEAVRLEIKPTNPNALIANQLEYAVELINSRRYADAENLLRGLLGGVEDYNARRHLLALYQDRQYHERWRRLARESVAKYAADAAFRTEYGRALLQHAQYQEVIGMFATSSRLNSDQQALLAVSYQRLDRHPDAIRHYRLALQQDVANAKNWIGLGISQEHSSELAAALDSYRRADRLGSLNPRLQAFVERRSEILGRVLN